MSIESLKNKGIVVAKPQSNHTQKTIIVVGVARGGTSIVSGVLNHLGVFMGNAQAPVYEDLRLSLAFEKQSKEKFETVIDDYNKQHGVWAWKRPSTLHALAKIARKVRNPHFVFVFRDMLSIANRNIISMHKDIAWGLKSALDDYSKIVKFINKSKYPALLISSEKAVKYKNDYIEALACFVGVTPTDTQNLTAQTFLSSNPTAYLDATRLTKAKGEVDKALLRAGRLKGWACYVVNHGEVQVEVVANGKVMATIKADQFEKQYKKSGIHPTGYCGFEADLRCLGVRPNDELVIRVKGDIVPLLSEKLSFEKWLLIEDLDGFVKPMGRINYQRIKTGFLAGWARTEHVDKAAMIGIYVNGQQFAMIPALLYRAHVKDNGHHPTGYCGYEFNLMRYGVLPSDSIEVKVENADLMLHSEPLTFPDLSKWLEIHELNQVSNQKVIQG